MTVANTRPLPTPPNIDALSEADPVIPPTATAPKGSKKRSGTALHTRKPVEPKSVVFYDINAVEGFAMATLWLIYRDPDIDPAKEKAQGMAILERVELSPGLQLVDKAFIDKYLEQDDELLQDLLERGALVKLMDSPDEIIERPTHEVMKAIGLCMTPVALPLLKVWAETAIMDNPKIAEVLNRQMQVIGGAQDQFAVVRNMIQQ
jgi:hypothetical protein